MAFTMYLWSTGVLVCRNLRNYVLQSCDIMDQKIQFLRMCHFTGYMHSPSDKQNDDWRIQGKLYRTAVQLVQLVYVSFIFCVCISFLTTGWPLVWKISKNLKMSGNLTAVGEMSGKCRGNNLVREKWPKTVYCWLYICIHSWLCWACAFHFGFGHMHCCISTHTIDNNTSTGMIWATLNMGRSAANRRGISHCLEGGHVVTRVRLFD